MVLHFGLGVPSRVTCPLSRNYRCRYKPLVYSQRFCFKPGIEFRDTGLHCTPSWETKMNEKLGLFEEE